MIGFHMRTDQPWLLNAVPSRLDEGPEGLDGGDTGAAGRFTVNGKPVSEAKKMTMAAGDMVVLETPGGGGYGRLATSREKGETRWTSTRSTGTQTPWEPVREGVERKAFSGDGATVSLNRLQPGHEPRPHDHPHEQIVYILSGQIDFHIGETVTRLGAGGLLVVPPNARHWGVVVGDEPVLNLDVFTPKRAEYAT